MFSMLVSIRFTFSTRLLAQDMLLGIEESFRGVLFYLVALYFLKRTFKLLPNRKRWSKIMNYLMVGVIVLFTMAAIYSLVTAS